MKKIYLSIMVLVSGMVSAQNLTDALRYSVEDLNGTARFKAMSGAFGALGGDFSAIGQNPAGSAVFSGSEMGFTFGDTSAKNVSTYFGTQSQNKASDFNLGQFGIVLVIPNNDSSDWKKFTLGFNYQNTKNFNANDLKFSGTTNTNLSDYFLYYANGIEQQNLMLDEYENKIKVRTISLQDLYDDYGNARRFNPFNLRNALLGYTVGIIKPESGKTAIDTSMSDAEADAVLQEKTYAKNISPNARTLQIFEQITKGDVHRYDFNFGTQYKENLFLGITLNSHRVDYSNVTKHQENYTGNTASTITGAFFQNEYKTTGSGFSFQMGAILKATESLRLGLVYQSPTWFRLREEMSQYLRTNTSDKGTFFANPQVVAVYPEYKFRTPSAWTASAAYIFGKKAIISMDYQYKGYGNTYFRSDNLKAENEIIANELGDVNIIRLGGEYRIKRLSLRAGYRYEQSPYKKTKYIGDLNGYSFGLGYAFSGLRLDVSYDVAQQNNQFQMYESVLTTPAKVETTRRNLLFTLSMKL